MKQIKQEFKLLKCVKKNQIQEAKTLLTISGGRKRNTLGRPGMKQSSESLDDILDVEIQEKLSHLDVNFKDVTTGYSALMYAISNENVELTSVLIHFCADVNIEDNKGNTPLHLAVFNSQSKIVNLLLSKGAKVNAANQDGNTPLHIACQQYGIGDKFLLLKLLQAKPDVTAKNKNGAMPLDVAAQYDKQEAVSMLLDHEPELRRSHRAFHEAAIRGHVGVLQLLLDYGIDPNVRDEDTGTTALHEACRYLRYEAAKLLLTYGADSNTKDINDEFFTAAPPFFERSLAEVELPKNYRIYYSAFEDVHKATLITVTPKAILAAYPVEKIDRFLKLFQDGTMARLRPKYTESPSERRRVTHHEQQQEAATSTDDSNAQRATNYLHFAVPPIAKTYSDATMPDFIVEGSPEANEDIELLVEEALVTGKNIYRLTSQGPDKPSYAVFTNIAMLQEGTYTITVRSVKNPEVRTSVAVCVENSVQQPADLEAMFDELEKMLQFD